jgi:ribosomal protein S21
MSIRVKVGEGESLAQALKRFQERVQMAYRRPWAKPRPGFYEKPSAIRRRRCIIRAKNAGGGGLKFYWRWQALWNRSMALRGFGR